MKMKRNIIIVFLAFITATIAVLFWNQEFKYSLPTPVPEYYRCVNLGNKIQLPEGLCSKNNKPVFLHFFNPDCPCSKFNIPHFKSLVKEYGNKATFAIVVMSNKNYSARQIQNRFDLDIPVLFDPSLAPSYGVYSTPQAVIIGTNEKLFYRGNYNRTRYCTDKKSNYAQQALDSLLSDKDSAIFNQFALKAYGCELPNCSKQ
jgi:thiol-disulfide isomerase/thioredoxin